MNPDAPPTPATAVSSGAPVHVAGVVPASGASRRMGRPKATLRLEGRTFVARAVDALAGGGCDPVLVVVESGNADSGDAARDAGAVVLENPDPGEGPVTSLRLAIRALERGEVGGPAAALAYLPVDHPAVRPATVATLLAEAAASGAPVTLPTHGGKRGHPAVFSRVVFAELLDPALEGGARTVVHRHLDAARLVDVDDPGVVTDVDTPQAYRALCDSLEDADSAVGREPAPPDGEHAP